MGMTYEETKQRKLKRMLGLRIMNAIGMVAWHDVDGEAKQRLRLIHPLTWVWVVVMAVYGTMLQGIPDTVSDLQHSLKYDTVWF